MKRIISGLLVLFVMISIHTVSAMAVDINSMSGSYYWVEGVNDPAALQSAAASGIRLNITPDGIGTLVLTNSTSIIKFDAPLNSATIVHLDGENTQSAFTFDAGVLTVGELIFKKTDQFTLEQAFGVQQTAPEVPQSPSDSKAPVGYWRTWTDSIGSHWIQVAHPVYNSGNTNLYLGTGSIDLEDSNGHLLDTMSLVSGYPQVLKPGETGWYYETTIKDQALNMGGFVAHPNLKDAKVDCIRLDVSDVSIKDDMFSGVTVTGRVTNNTGRDQSMVYVVANLFDRDGNILGQVMTILSNSVAAGDTIGFSASEMGSNPDLTAAAVASYEIYAFPQQFQFG